MASIYEQVFEGDWTTPRHSSTHLVACCDCGLVHKLDFRVKAGKFQFRAYRDNRRTGQRRRNRPELVCKVVKS